MENPADAVLAEMGYAFVPGASAGPHDWVLRQKDDLSKGYEWRGQNEYDALGAAVVDWIRARLTLACGLEEVTAGIEPATAYATPGWQNHPGPFLLLVCGSAPGGTAGVWGRSLCINESTLQGAMFDYIARGHCRGWAIIVADPHADDCPHRHLARLISLLPQQEQPGRLLVVAHSYGAACTLGMLKAVPAAQRRLEALTLTDGMRWSPEGWDSCSLLDEAVPTREELLAAAAGPHTMGDAKYGQYGSDSDALPQAYQPANANQYVPPASGFQGVHTLTSIAVDRTPQQSYQPANSSQYVPPASGFQGVGMPPVQYAPPAYSQQTVQIPAAPQQWQYNPGQYVQAPLVNQPIQAPSQYMMPSLPIQAPVQQYPTAQSLYATPTYSATYGGFANPQLADGQPGMQPGSSIPQMMPMAAPALQGMQFAQQAAVFPNQYTAPQPQLQTAPTMGGYAPQQPHQRPYSPMMYTAPQPQLQTAPTMGGYAPQQPQQRPYSPMMTAAPMSAPAGYGAPMQAHQQGYVATPQYAVPRAPDYSAYLDAPAGSQLTPEQCAQLGVPPGSRFGPSKGKQNNYNNTTDYEYMKHDQPSVTNYSAPPEASYPQGSYSDGYSGAYSGAYSGGDSTRTISLNDPENPYYNQYGGAKRMPASSYGSQNQFQL